VLAAHGSRHEPAVNAQVRAWATEVAARTDFAEVAVAFHQGTPQFCEVLDELHAVDVTVVPVMTSAGYYSNTVLPRELARNRRYAEMQVRQTPLLGTHFGVIDLFIERADALAESSKDTTLAVVGHGTPRHPASRDSTHALVNELSLRGGYGEVVAVFLDDDPPIERLLAIARNPHIVVLPFFIGAGPHAILDIPTRIGMSVFGQEPPFRQMVSGKNIICDAPLGAQPRLVDLIVDLACCPARNSFDEQEVA